MPRLHIPRDLLARIEKAGLRMELKGFWSAISNGQHPPRVYKRSGIHPLYPPYEELELYHHHLHRDGDPLLITQHVDGEIYCVALSTHEIYFREDKMLWLKKHAHAIDWGACPHLKTQVDNYEPEVDPDEVDHD